MVAGQEDARRSVAQSDLHIARQNEHPLRLWRAMPLAAKSDRAVAQLVARRGKNLREHRLRGAFAEWHRLRAEFGAAVAVGVENDLGEGLHGLSRFCVSHHEKSPHARAFLSCLTSYSGRMFVACSPFGPVVTSNVTFWFSFRLLKPEPWIAEKCAKRSLPPPSGVMNP